MLAQGSVAQRDFSDNDKNNVSDHLDRSANDRSAINQSNNDEDLRTGSDDSKKKGKQNFEKYYEYESKKKNQ